MRANDPPSVWTPLTPIVMAARASVRLGLGVRLGKVLSRMATPTMANPRAFGPYTERDGDVIVATYPKSGTNWLLQIGQQIAWRGAAEFDHIHAVVPWPDAPTDKVVKMDAPLRSPTGHRIIKTHLGAPHTPRGPLRIAVLRDPKEVVVSSYFFLGGLLGILDYMTVGEWCELFLADALPMGGWAEHSAGWYDERERDDTLVLNFAAIKKDLPGHVDAVAEFMGVELEESERAAVIERSGLPWMKAHERQFAPPPLPGFSRMARPAMIRRGRSGGSDELLSLDQQQAIDRHCRYALMAAGCALPYDDWFSPVG
jgi:hypothetical protein